MEKAKKEIEEQMARFGVSSNTEGDAYGGGSSSAETQEAKVAFTKISEVPRLSR